MYKKDRVFKKNVCNDVNDCIYGVFNKVIFINIILAIFDFVTLYPGFWKPYLLYSFAFLLHQKY